MYNDFPILSNEEYFALAQKFSQQKIYNREQAVIKTFFALSECKNLSFSLTEKLNIKISTALKDANKNIETCINNLLTAFEFDSKPAQEIKEFNIFAYLNKLNLSAGCMFEVYVNEQKEYHKKIASANIKLIVDTIQMILSALESSTIKFFKFI